jgi:hypothetical protein
MISYHEPAPYSGKLNLSRDNPRTPKMDCTIELDFLITWLSLPTLSACFVLHASARNRFLGASLLRRPCHLSPCPPCPRTLHTCPLPFAVSLVVLITAIVGLLSCRCSGAMATLSNRPSCAVLGANTNCATFADPSVLGLDTTCTWYRTPIPTGHYPWYRVLLPLLPTLYAAVTMPATTLYVALRRPTSSSCHRASTG